MQSMTFLHLSFFGLLVSSFFLEGIETVSCPESWLAYKDKCRGLFTEEKTWTEAEVACQRYGQNGHLASFLSAQENTMVAQFIAANYPGIEGVWIGFHDPKKNGRWKWTDLATTNFRPWKIGERIEAPSEKACVYMVGSEGFKGWMNDDCQVKRPYVCKMG
ncbi:C-type lectin lectoxin-Thr1-like [Anolis sagrei]|uniref:C-type lectin lectoxin-Thr1-like n=1 Tax=Anolis sagrei TaxID=38937 RepID=UPI003522481A